MSIIDKGLSINCLKERRLENLMTQYFTGLLGGNVARQRQI